jgi:hypothetical protein
MEIHGRGLADRFGYLLRLDCCPTASNIEGSNRYRVFGVVPAQVLDSTTCRPYWAAQACSTKAVDNFLVAYSIFLHCESVGHRRGTVYFGVTAQHCVEPSWPDVQVHILQPERCVVACGPGVLPRPEEEKNAIVIISPLTWVSSCRAACLSKDVYDDNNGDWFDSFWQRVFPLVCPDLSLDSEIYVTVDVFSDIRGPHPGERLADRTQCVLHC